MILRLCQDIILMKDELAELLLSHVLVNLARTKGSQVDLCKLISSLVQENIFTEYNELIKSVQIMLDALIETRLYRVMERGGTSSAPLKRDSPKKCTSRKISGVELKLLEQSLSRLKR
ncbi:hypothetical protein C5167_042487 [Papaver somniferum]|uniref:Uncharacterized protein n=1 Tax=Papaver somniferum TaxID=3469 RepID=A0A4Y7L5K6_PAPSO|nr:hypothetical protein C5167_042487 [Papaver somniferum]